MKKQYETMLILDLQGKEEGVEEVVLEIKNAIESLGGEFMAAQRMDRRKFERAAQKLDSGYYLGVRHELDSSKIEELRQKFVLDKKVFRQVDFVVQDKVESAA